MAWMGLVMTSSPRPNRYTFSLLIAKPLGTQFIDDQTVAIFEFERSEGIVRVASERHYRLVESEDLTEEDILNYRNRLLG